MSTETYTHPNFFEKLSYKPKHRTQINTKARDSTTVYDHKHAMSMFIPTKHKEALIRKI